MPFITTKDGTSLYYKDLGSGTPIKSTVSCSPLSSPDSARAVFA
jgi:hypothetical protein